MTRAFGRVEDFVVEYGEVERQAESDRVRRLHLGFGNVECLAVRLLRVVDHGYRRKNTHLVDILRDL